MAETIVARLRKALETRTWVNLPEDIRQAADELENLAEWAAELHRQLEKIWYTPKGTAYSDDEAWAVIEVLGPTDDAVPDWGPRERAKYWREKHGG